MEIALLFIIYFNDFLSHIGCTADSYADDKTLSVGGKSNAALKSSKMAPVNRPSEAEVIHLLYIDRRAVWVERCLLKPCIS